jgi:type IV pilus assembly protein PilA
MKKQSGFTLIELMIVVAIVGILAALALPAYQDYIVRSKLSEVMAELAESKTSVSEFVSSENDFPTDSDQAGIATNSGFIQSLTFSRIDVDNGSIVATLDGTDLTADLDGVIVAMMGSRQAAGSNEVEWTCATDAAASSPIGAAAYKYFPASCRNVYTN